MMETEMRTLTTIPTQRRTNAPIQGTPRQPARARRPPVKQGPWRRIRSAAAEISPDAIERIAQRVAQLLRHDPPPHDDADEPRDLMDAGQLAKHLGLTRAWVYEHAETLGAIQIGNGPRPRLRFDPTRAREALSERQRRDESVNTLVRPTGRPRRRPTGKIVPLLPVHESRVRGIFRRRVL
jgi:hypothetical protein